MNVLTKAGWDVVRLGLLAGAIVFAGVGIGQESPPATASHTQVFLSYSNISPIYASTIVVNPDGLPRELYVWAVNVDNDTGVSSYHQEIGFDSSLLTAAGGTKQVDIIDGQVDVDRSGTVDDADDFFNVLLKLAAGGTNRVSIFDGKVDVDLSGTVDAADDLAGVLLHLAAGGTPNQVDIIDGQVDVDQSSAVDAADDLANALLLTITGMAPDPPMWLGTSERVLVGLGPGQPGQASCAGQGIEAGVAYLDCNTTIPPMEDPGELPPDLTGALGTGLLGKLTILPGSVSQTSSLDLTETYLNDTPPPPEFLLSEIPVTLLSSVVVYLDCADVNGDGIVDLLNDILGIIQRYQWTPENHPDDWVPAYDINNDDVIDLLNDILGAIMQYQLPCTQTP